MFGMAGGGLIRSGKGNEFVFCEHGHKIAGLKKFWDYLN
jgi:hypothetical protein